MRINEKGRYAGAALPNTEGLNLQNVLESETGEISVQSMHEAGLDNTNIQFLKRGLERG
ncbi:hypothetical protein [Siminovitchia acidinfaciens]|uniref:hypothetical protein n=1 Tax=Siminovitchia acidinfaciens TaxID=2321395 RepID=UPI0013DF05FE|nr:hypothetical protein [Siminovitchia acidinfaciens]